MSGFIWQKILLNFKNYFMKKLESLKLKKFKMQSIKGGKTGPTGPGTGVGIEEDSYKADYTYNGTYYVNDTVKYD